MPRLAVLGHPISHSRSPAMQTAALEEMGLADEWSYEAIEVAPDDFEERVRAMPAEGFLGANVTVPHKLAARELADSFSRAVAEIGAANTLTFAGSKVTADNTDAIGITASLPSSPEGRRTLVLGAGGSARAAVWALKRAGARVSVWNRTESKAEALAGELGAEVVSLPEPSSDLPLGDFDLLLNATSVGLATANRGTDAPEGRLGADPDYGPPDLKSLHVGADALNAEHVVVDLVYGAAETQLAAVARSRGATVVDGLEVLVRQGAASLRLWTGEEPPIEMMRRAARGTEWPEKSAPDT